MKNPRSPHYFNIFPTGNIPVPVCIGDLPMSDFTITRDVVTEDVAAFLEANPFVPGAIIVADGKAGGVIPRYKMFERLGHRYGVELFLRKPVVEIERELEADVFALKSHLAINLAVKLALSRSQAYIYDPIIVEYEHGRLRLLDMYVLLLSQSQLSNNLSGIVSFLNHIETILESGRAEAGSTLEMIMENLGKVVPSHDSHVVLQRGTDAAMFAHTSILRQDGALERNSVYRSTLSMNQSVVLEDVRIVPAWTNWDTPPNTRSWLGAPISNQNGPVGLISLSRTTFSPFTNHEKEISLVFARYLGKLFEHALRQTERNRMFDKKYFAR
jgi:hypothetical protein